MKMIPLILWFAFGAAPGFFGMKYLGELRGFMERAVETEATILDFRYEDAGTADHVNNDFRMWAEFEYVDGRVISAPTNFSTSNQTERIGEPITILYDPDNVSPVRVKSLASLYLLPGGLLGFASLIWVFGLWRTFSAS